MAFTTHFSIIDGIKHDSETAWDRFLKCYAPLIKLHGRDCGLDENYLDDLVQEVLLAISKTCENFNYDASRGHFRNYLRRIIRNKANDILREKYRNARLPVPEEEDDTLDELFMQEWKEHIRTNALRLLRQSVTPMHYQIFEMINVHDKKPKFVADFYKMPLQTVYSINSRTEEKLKTLASQLDV